MRLSSAMRKAVAKARRNIAFIEFLDSPLMAASFCFAPWLSSFRRYSSTKRRWAMSPIESCTFVMPPVQWLDMAAIERARLTSTPHFT